MIDASFQKKQMYFTIIIGEMDFYCNLLDWRTCAVRSGKASFSLLNSSWDKLEEIVTYMTGSRIVTNKKYWICIKGYLNIDLICICICKTCCKAMEIIVSTVTRRTRLCWMRIGVFRFWTSCAINFTTDWCIIDTFIFLGISLGIWCLCLLYYFFWITRCFLQNFNNALLDFFFDFRRAATSADILRCHLRLVLCFCFMIWTHAIIDWDEMHIQVIGIMMSALIKLSGGLLGGLWKILSMAEWNVDTK